MDAFLDPGLAARLMPEGLAARKAAGAALLIASAALIMLALSRPQYGIRPLEARRSGVDVMILIDTSFSMAAADVKPSRIERAKLELSRLVKALEGNRIGLMAFAGESFLECPMTLDSGAIRLFLDGVGVGIIPTPGTAIGAAVNEAVKAMKRSGAAKTRAIILVTDGEDLEGEVDQAAASAKEAGIKIYGVGIGSASGAPIPRVNELGEIVGYKNDPSGAPMLTRLDTRPLAGLASATGGVFIASQGESLDISKVIDSLKSQEKTDVGSFEFSEYEERYRPLAALALALLAGEYALMAWWKPRRMA
jgi:Ca-activated chloride channel family protein